MFEKDSKVFELPLFSSSFLEDLVRESKITGTPAETVDRNRIQREGMK